MFIFAVILSQINTDFNNILCTDMSLSLNMYNKNDKIDKNNILTFLNGALLRSHRCRLQLNKSGMKDCCGQFN